MALVSMDALRQGAESVSAGDEEPWKGIVEQFDLSALKTASSWRESFCAHASWGAVAVGCSFRGELSFPVSLGLGDSCFAENIPEVFPGARPEKDASAPIMCLHHHQEG